MLRMLKRLAVTSESALVQLVQLALLALLALLQALPVLPLEWRPGSSMALQPSPSRRR